MPPTSYDARIMTRTPLSHRILATTTLFASLLLPFANAAQAAGKLLKGSGPSLYYQANDGKRYAFPSEAVYTSWYPATADVSYVSDSSLANVPLGGTVTMRPGSTLIKIATNPRVYAVSRYGVLHWITNETVANAIFGASWNKHILDVPDTFFTNYIVGADVSDASMYSPSAELASAQTPDDNLRPVNFVPPAVTTPSTPASVANPAVVNVALSATQGVLNQNIQIFATVTSSTLPITKIEIHSESNSGVLASCNSSTTCSYSFNVATAPQLVRYFAVATDSSGATFQTSVSDRPVLTVNSTTDQIHISATPLVAIVGSRVSLSSDASLLPAISSHKIYGMVPGNPMPVLFKDCGATSLCSGSIPFYRTTMLYAQVVSESQTLVSSAVTLMVTGGAAPKATLSVVGQPSNNRVQIDATIPNGEMINPTAIVDGTSIKGNVLALCSSNCSITLQVNVPGSVTAFTWIGGAYEMSNTITVTPTAP